MNRFKKPKIHLAQYRGTVCYGADDFSAVLAKEPGFLSKYIVLGHGYQLLEGTLI
jgi:hypothetical protein